MLSFFSFFFISLILFPSYRRGFLGYRFFFFFLLWIFPRRDRLGYGGTGRNGMKWDHGIDGWIGWGWGWDGMRRSDWGEGVECGDWDNKKIQGEWMIPTFHKTFFFFLGRSRESLPLRCNAWTTSGLSIPTPLYLPTDTPHTKKISNSGGKGVVFLLLRDFLNSLKYPVRPPAPSSPSAPSSFRPLRGAS